LKDKLFAVGEYIADYNETLEINLPCGSVYQSIGLESHISKSHPHCIKYMDNISEIIAHPDYIGKNPSEPYSVELIKQYDANILLAIKLDVKKGYLYVASLYDISESKIKNRLNSGRIQKYKA
jgi:hypothetical protein